MPRVERMVPLNIWSMALHKMKPPSCSQVHDLPLQYGWHGYVIKPGAAGPTNSVSVAEVEVRDWASSSLNNYSCSPSSQPSKEEARQRPLVLRGKTRAINSTIYANGKPLLTYQDKNILSA